MTASSIIRRAATTVASRLPALPLKISRFDLVVSGLTRDLDGFCLAQISDLHIGAEPWAPAHVRQVGEVIRKAQPNVVVNTGDFAQGLPSSDRVTATLREFNLVRTSDCRHIAILGNHDYFLDQGALDELTSLLEDHGIEVLTNRLAGVRAHGSGVSVVGLTAEVPGFEEAVDALLKSGRPRVALVHEPDLAELLPTGAADLVLAGHTHGAQIAIPRFENLIVRKYCGSRYVAGAYRVNGNPVYVNAGLGYVGLPLRFRAAPEVTIIRLVR